MVIVRSWSGNLPLIMAIEFHFYEVKSSMEIDGDSYMYLVQLNCIIKNTYDEPAKWLSGKSYLWPSLLVWVQFWELCEVRRRVPLHKVSSFPPRSRRSMWTPPLCYGHAHNDKNN